MFLVKDTDFKIC